MCVGPIIKVRGNLYKPDLIIKNEERILVVDVTVRYENRDYLLNADKEKIDKYLPCLKQLKSIYGLKEGAIIPVVFGSRGVITTRTKEFLYELGLNNNKIKTIIMNVFENSI